MYKSLYFFVFLVLVLSNTSCKDEKMKEVFLQGERVECDSDFWGTSSFLLYDKFLFTKSSLSETQGVISILDNKHLGGSQEIFRTGNGNNEFHNIAISEGLNSSLLVLDYSNLGNKMLSLTQIRNTKSIESIKDTKMWKKYSLLDLPSFRCVFKSFVSLSDTTILVPGSCYDNIGHLLSIIDYENQIVTPLDYWPADGVEGDSLAKHSVYTDNCRIFRNNRKQYLYKCGEERFAFVFSIEHNRIKVHKELYSMYPNYICRNDGNYDITKRSGNFLYIDATNEYIYAFLQELIQNNRSYSRSGNIIEVFDWDGNLVKRIKLDKKGDQIKVNKENDILYLFTTNDESGEEEIWMYRM